jgi:hypothetical protein
LSVGRQVAVTGAGPATAFTLPDGAVDTAPLLLQALKLIARAKLAIAIQAVFTSGSSNLPRDADCDWGPMLTQFFKHKFSFPQTT